MWGVTLWEKVFVENEKKDLSELRKISNAVWEQDMVSKENEMAILRRTEKAMMRATCGVKIIEKRRSQELLSLQGIKDTLDGLARESGVRWYGHVLRRDNGDVLRRALDFDLKWQEEGWAAKYDVEETSGGAYQSGWTKKGRCH